LCSTFFFENSHSQDVSKFPYLTAELLRRGYSEDDVVGMFGANLVRVFRQVEHVRDRLSHDVPAQGLLFPKRACRSTN
jgi:membrane dipeptidase